MFDNLRGLRCPTYVLMRIMAMERGLPSPTVCLEAMVRMRLEIVVRRWVGQITRYTGMLETRLGLVGQRLRMLVAITVKGSGLAAKRRN